VCVYIVREFYYIVREQDYVKIRKKKSLTSPLSVGEIITIIISHSCVRSRYIYIFIYYKPHPAAAVASATYISVGVYIYI